MPDIAEFEGADDDEDEVPAASTAYAMPEPQADTAANTAYAMPPPAEYANTSPSTGTAEYKNENSALNQSYSGNNYQSGNQDNNGNTSYFIIII